MSSGPGQVVVLGRAQEAEAVGQASRARPRRRSGRSSRSAPARILKISSCLRRPAAPSTPRSLAICVSSAMFISLSARMSRAFGRLARSRCHRRGGFRAAAAFCASESWSSSFLQWRPFLLLRESLCPAASARPRVVSSRHSSFGPSPARRNENQRVGSGARLARSSGAVLTRRAADRLLGLSACSSLPRRLRRDLPREKFGDGFPEFTDSLP